MTIIIGSKDHPEWKDVFENICNAEFRIVNAETGVIDMTSSDGVNKAKEYDPKLYEVKVYDNT